MTHHTLSLEKYWKLFSATLTAICAFEPPFCAYLLCGSLLKALIARKSVDCPIVDTPLKLTLDRASDRLRKKVEFPRFLRVKFAEKAAYFVGNSRKFS